MSRHLFPALAASAFIALSPVAAQDIGELEALVDEGIAAIEDGKSKITIGSRSVEPGNVLLLEDISLKSNSGDPGELSTDWIRIAPLADAPGHVRITVAPEVLLKVVLPETEGTTDFILENQGFELTSNLMLGAAGKPAGQISAQRLALRAGDADHPMIKHVNIALDDLALEFTADEAARSGEGSFSVANMIADYDIQGPDGERIKMASSSDGIEISFAGAGIPEDDTELSEFLSTGGFVRLAMTSGPSTSQMASDSAEMPVSFTATSDGGEMGLVFDETGFDLDFDLGRILYRITPNENAPLPIPAFDVGLARMEVRMAMPVLPQEQASTGAIKIAFTDLTVGDALWSLIDPGATIPRDPVSLDIDLTSMVRLFKPLDQAEDGQSPMELGEFSDIRIRAMNASGGGASVTGSGAVDIDYSGPMPMPQGQIDVAIKGVQGLSQALVNLGLIEQMQAGMMMGGIMAFSKPGEEADSFTSLIEFRDGQVLANGAPIPIQ